MPVEISSLDQIDDADVQQAFLYAAQLLLEKYPNLDTRRGVIGDLTLKLDANLSAGTRTTISRLSQSMSLKAIEADPTLADTDIVDAVLSNFRVTRRDPGFATGEVTLVLDRQISLTIAAGLTFAANGKQYTSDSAFAVRTSDVNVVADTDRLLQQIGPERYAFTINVTAVEAGPTSQAKKDDKFVPLVAPIGFVNAFASSDFSTASSIETNQELLDRLETGMAARAASNRTTTLAMIQNAFNEGHPLAVESFADIVAISFIGNSDEEMQRDQHWLFPASGGGRVDAYVRSQPLYSQQALTVTATLIDVTADGGTWQFSLDRDAFPGMYEVSRINLPTDTEESGFKPLEQLRGLDVTADIYVPDVVTVQEGTFSRYQAMTVRFVDTATATGSLVIGTATADYVATLRGMPLIAELQTYLGNRSVGAPGSDMLVKAAVPCFLQLSFNLYRKRTTATIDTAAIASAVVTYVNATGFIGTLYASDLTAVITALLPDKVSVGSIDMFGRILMPDGTNRYIRDDAALTIPSDASVFLSGRTAVFQLAAEDVSISEVSADVPEV